MKWLVLQVQKIPHRSRAVIGTCLFGLVASPGAVGFQLEIDWNPASTVAGFPGFAKQNKRMAASAGAVLQTMDGLREADQRELTMGRYRPADAARFSARAQVAMSEREG